MASAVKPSTRNTPFACTIATILGTLLILACAATMCFTLAQAKPVLGRTLQQELPFMQLPELDVSSVAGTEDLVALAVSFLGTRRMWQVLNAIAFVVNFVMVSVGGRIDSRYADTKGIPKDDEYRGLVTPAGWAFAIWGIIFMGEIAFTVYQVACTPSEGEQFQWLEALSPWFTAACGFQALWCVAFREWTRPVFWLPALMLSGIAAALGGAQAELSRAAVGMTWLQYGLVHAPLSIHFGWVSAAALVNWNSYAALLVHDGVISKPAQMSIANMSIAVAALAGIQVSLVRSDALYGLTIAWALMAVKADGKKQMETISGSERAGMEDLAVSAQYGAYASVLASCYVALSDPINSLLATRT